MCGRFLFQPDQNEEIGRIFKLAYDAGYDVKVGEFLPTD